MESGPATARDDWRHPAAAQPEGAGALGRALGRTSSSRLAACAPGWHRCREVVAAFVPRFTCVCRGPPVPIAEVERIVAALQWITGSRIFWKSS